MFRAQYYKWYNSIFKIVKYTSQKVDMTIFNNQQKVLKCKQYLGIYEMSMACDQFVKCEIVVIWDIAVHKRIPPQTKH